MTGSPLKRQTVRSNSDDTELVRRALARDADAFRVIMQRHNRRLYRIARGVLRDSRDAEDVVQDAYVSAFTHLASYRGESTLATWLSRIVINEALGRLRRERSTVHSGPLEPPPHEAEIIQFPLSTMNDDPERSMAQRQMLQLVQQAIDNLPEVYRLVLVMRVIEGMSVEETSDLLRVKPETVKTRLHRARQLLREQLNRQIGPVLMNAFPFAGGRCERVTEAVIRRLGLSK
jgi:RNA polymerase sigma-70 factor, ECF subfamily